MNRLAQRIITAVVLAALLAVVLFVLPPTVALVVISSFVLVGAWEWSQFIGLRKVRSRSLYSVSITALMAMGLWVLSDAEFVNMILQASLLWWLVAFLWVLRYPTGIRKEFAAFCGALVLVPAWFAAGHLLLVVPQGAELIFLVLVVVWMADIGAYFIGRRFGRVKLAPRVSPGKTWEGLLGGLSGAVIGAAIGGLFMGWPLSQSIPLGLSVGAISVVGDLTVSMFKRNVGLKDSGKLFPGHGGILDRIDSITAAVPLYVTELSSFGLLSAG